MAAITCKRGPVGFRCKRPWPHIGPCALEPTRFALIFHAITRRRL
jgi:hypothetical protein